MIIWYKKPSHGAFHAHLGDHSIRLEWSPMSMLGGALSITGDGEFKVSALGPLSVWFTVEGPMVRRAADVLIPDDEDDPTLDDREVAMSLNLDTECVSGPMVSWNLWKPIWISGTPTWRHGSAFPLDAILGMPEYAVQVLETRDVKIPMPEGNYPGKAYLTEETWRRPGPGIWQALGFDSLPWLTEKVQRVTIETPQGIPHPGKGENAWNCGEDGLYSLTTANCSIEDGIGRVVASVLRSRKRYGGEGWEPEALARRVLPFVQDRAGLYQWERRNVLTGEWLPVGVGPLAEATIRHHYTVVERPCGCCEAPYGTPCTDLECPNRGPRGQQIWGHGSKQ